MEAVYLQRRMIPLNSLIPEDVQHPRPLRVINVKIVDWFIDTADKNKLKYQLLFTVKNWHHLEIALTFDHDYDLLSFHLVRLYERVPYPWKLVNYLRTIVRHNHTSYFAVAYVN